MPLKNNFWDQPGWSRGVDCSTETTSSPLYTRSCFLIYIYVIWYKPSQEAVHTCHNSHTLQINFFMVRLRGRQAVFQKITWRWETNYFLTFSASTGCIVKLRLQSNALTLLFELYNTHQESSNMSKRLALALHTFTRMLQGSLLQT